jgi:hypothetical protein
MKSDDPRLEKSLQEAVARTKRINDMMVTVLKNHLVVEQFMDEFIAARGKKSHGRFSDKVDHCERLKPPEIEPEIWTVLKKANKLRNEIAHSLDQAKIQINVDELRAAYLAALSDKQRPHSEKLEDILIASGAFELCGAYLVGATVAVEDRKREAQKSTAQ